jgi:integrase
MKGLYRPKYRDAGGTIRQSAVWWVRYRDHGRTRRQSTQTTNHEEAKRFLNLRRGAIAKGEPVNPRADRVTFHEMAADLRRDYEKNSKDHVTLEARLGHLEAFFGQQRMARLIPDDVERYIEHRRQAKAANGTINRELGVLGRTFSLGVKLGKLTAAFPVRHQRLAEAQPRSGFFEREQFEAVVKHLPEHLRPVAIFAYETGWRLQEVISREWRHVDLDAGTVRLEPGETKNKRPRMIYGTPELLEVLTGQRQRVDVFQRTRGRIIPWVFFRPDGRPVKSFRKAWKRACFAAGCPGRIFHDFRRTAVRDLVRRGVNTEVAMRVTGHLTRDVFGRYNIVSDQDMREAAAKMAGRVRLEHQARLLPKEQSFEQSGPNASAPSLTAVR